MFSNATYEQIARIEEILRLLDQAPDSKSNANRRQARRVNIRITMSGFLLSETGKAAIKMFTRNISTSGIGFVCRRLCKSGERLAMTFNLPEKPSKLVLGQITFCRYVKAGVYAAGMEFMECLSGVDEESIPARWIRGSQAKPAGSNKPATGAKAAGSSKPPSPAKSPAPALAGQ